MGPGLWTWAWDHGPKAASLGPRAAGLGPRAAGTMGVDYYNVSKEYSIWGLCKGLCRGSVGLCKSPGNYWQIPGPRNINFNTFLLFGLVAPVLVGRIVQFFF